MRGWIATIGYALALSFAPHCLLAQEITTLRVGLQISATDDIASEVESYLRRELRSLGDVEITQEGALYHLHVVAMTVENRAGTTTGAVFAVAISQPITAYVEVLRSTIAPTAQQQTVLDYLTLVQSFEDLWVQSASDDDLRELCAELIADFDVDYLEPVRSAISVSGVEHRGGQHLENTSDGLNSANHGA